MELWNHKCKVNSVKQHEYSPMYVSFYCCNCHRCTFYFNAVFFEETSSGRLLSGCFYEEGGQQQQCKRQTNHEIKANTDADNGRARRLAPSFWGEWCRSRTTTAMAWQRRETALGVSRRKTYPLIKKSMAREGRYYRLCYMRVAVNIRTGWNRRITLTPL